MKTKDEIRNEILELCDDCRSCNLVFTCEHLIDLVYKMIKEVEDEKEET